MSETNATYVKVNGELVFCGHYETDSWGYCLRCCADLWPDAAPPTKRGQG